MKIKSDFSLKLKISLLTLFFNLLFTIPYAQSSASSSQITDLLPETTDILLQCSSLNNIYNTFSITDSSFWGEPIEDLEELKSELGFNPFDLDEFDKNGFDMQRPSGIAISDITMNDENEEPDANLIVFLPVKDGNKAMAWIRQIIEKNNESVKFQQIGELWQWEFQGEGEPYIEENGTDGNSYTENNLNTEDSSEQGEVTEKSLKQNENTETTTEQGQATENSKGEDGVVDEDDQYLISQDDIQALDDAIVYNYPNYMIAVNGYVLLGTNPARDARSFFENIKNNSGKLGSSKAFIKTMKKLEGGKDILFYANMEHLMKQPHESMAFLSLFFLTWLKFIT
ncbi:exported hypothetical protein [Desulfamplus magnetovallimortis]|uniref:Uncharacterized protein n=1 Tax=Desulfamplus magnetovallimortis TaxID=1246637 RepID=L0R536_9BACT|nr:hypothetical protein [Desulfamplus magnetovallimortis]CCO06635.1 exported hypothetical protein [Desulfamplus magnetovallimortis BW-1]SLM32686.1 exported hypothetical protein [Desulfamplus magnetovallimortis]